MTTATLRAIFRPRGWWWIVLLLGPWVLATNKDARASFRKDDKR